MTTWPILSVVTFLPALGAVLVYALARAPLAGEVPYPFLDVAKNGPASVAISALAITGLFLVLSVIAVLADRSVSRLRAPGGKR